MNDFMKTWAMSIVFLIVWGYGSALVDNGISFLEGRCSMPYSLITPRCQND